MFTDEKHEFNLDGKKIEIVFQEVFTGKLRTEILQTIKEFGGDEITDKKLEMFEKLVAAKTKEEGTLTAEQLKDLDQTTVYELMAGGGITLREVLKGEENDGKYLELVFALSKIVIDLEATVKKEQKKELREALREAYDKAVFWNAQNLTMLEDGIEFFRSKIKRAI